MSSQKDTPLIKAIINRKIDAARLLINFGANVDTFFKLKFSYLRTIVKNDDLEMVEFLISIGMNINIKDSYGTNLFFFAKSIEMAELLRRNGLQVEKNLGDLYHVLDESIRLKNVKLMKFFVENGANVNAMSNYEHMELLKDSKILKFAIDSGIDVNRRASIVGSTLLIHAAYNRDVEAMLILFESGKVDLNVQNNIQQTALSEYLTHNKNPSFLVIRALATRKNLGMHDHIDRLPVHHYIESQKNPKKEIVNFLMKF